MALSSSIKNIFKTVTSTAKDIGGNVAKNFDDVPFLDGVTKTAKPIFEKGTDGVKKAGAKLSETEIGKKAREGATKASNSYVGNKAQQTGDWFRKHTYDQSAYGKARDEFVSGKSNVRPKKSDFRTGNLIDADPDKFTGYRLNEIDAHVKWGMFGGALAVSGGISGGLTYAKSKEESRYGDVYGDLSVGTINATYSPTHDKIVNSIVNNGNAGAVNNIDGDFSSKFAGVNPEIVFALHELRNGGGM